MVKNSLPPGGSDRIMQTISGPVRHNTSRVGYRLDRADAERDTVT